MLYRPGTDRHLRSEEQIIALKKASRLLVKRRAR
jgi:hypothetical protein